MHWKLRITACEEGERKERQGKLASILAAGVYRYLKRRGRLREGRRPGRGGAAPKPAECGEVMASEEGAKPT